MKRNLLAACLLLSRLPARAQGGVDMADAFRADGKIYVVVGVLTIVLAVLFVYLALIDRKVRRLERDAKNQGGE